MPFSFLDPPRAFGCTLTIDGFDTDGDYFQVALVLGWLLFGRLLWGMLFALLMGAAFSTGSRETSNSHPSVRDKSIKHSCRNVLAPFWHRQAEPTPMLLDEIAPMTRGQRIEKGCIAFARAVSHNLSWYLLSGPPP